MRSLPSALIFFALTCVLTHLGCSSEEEKVRPPLPEARSVTAQEPSPPITTPPPKPAVSVQEQFLANPDDIVMASEWIDTLNEVVELCAKKLLNGDVFAGTKPAPKEAEALRAVCPLFLKVPKERLNALIGLSNDLDQAVQNFAALDAELEHLYALLANKIDVPLERYPELLSERKTALHRKISDVRNGIRSAANDLLDGSLENPSVAALTALVPDPQTLVETATHLVNRFVTGPVWQALIQDVRYRLIKGHPVYQTRDLLVIKSATLQAQRIRARITLITQRRNEFKGGQDAYWEAVFEYLEQMQKIAEDLDKATDYDSRLLVLKQLQRIPKGSRKEIRERATDWASRVKSYVDSAKGRNVTP